MRFIERFLCLLVLLCLLTAAWFVAPNSLAEALFRWRLSEAVEKSSTPIQLSDLASFEWVEVCEHHGYDGDFKHPVSGRIYTAPSSSSHDGIWSLLFIAENGEPTYITGSCKRGGAKILPFACMPRKQAVLELVASSNECPNYIGTSSESNLTFPSMGRPQAGAHEVQR
ncbi:MAG: hypothetical protein ACM3SV_00650 [Betaproteobacteria bacterium]